jgi:predicted phage terminase large subunit-like protein
MTTAQKIELINALDEKTVRIARRKFSGFVRYIKADYDMQWFHRLICGKLQQFAEGLIKKLMICIPPQHGKSELTSRLFPPYLLGIKPTLKLLLCSYSATMASKFNRSCQRYIDSPAYTRVFPDTKLSGKGIRNVGTWLRNNDIFEIVKHGGYLMNSGRTGITGNPVDIGILDDLIKDRAEALSPTIRDNAWEFVTDSFETRLHNLSQILFITTRWHEDDPAGRFLKRDNDWDVVILPALKIGGPTLIDPRNDGEALWEGKHSKERLLRIQETNPYWDSLYQQDPKPLKGLMYTAFKTYKSIPLVKDYIVKAYVDTADEGDDFLCSIVYAVTEIGIFILDVIYTQEGMEVTENQVAVQLTKYNVINVDIESNNGGRGFARAVERNLRIIGNVKTRIEWFFQSENKAARIYSNSAVVQNMIYYPEGWNIMYSAFFNSLTGYLKSGKNVHDDAEDALTGVWEKNATVYERKDTGTNYTNYMH